MIYAYNNSLAFSADDKKAPSEFFSSWAYFPLSFASPDGIERIIRDLEDKINDLERHKKLPPGLMEQYKIQLQSLREPKVPDCQHTAFPGHGGNLGESHSSKNIL